MLRLMMMRLYFADLTHTAQGISAPTFPLGISFVAAYVKEHFGEHCSTEIFKFPSDLINAIIHEQPDVLLVSNYSWNSQISYKVAEKTKQKWPKIVVIAGGPNFPTDPNEQFKFLKSKPAIDFFVQLEGELGALEVLNNLLQHEFDYESFKNTKLAIVNTAYLVGEDLIVGENKRIKDINMIPSPYLTGALDQFFDLPILPMIETTRGCPFTCTFCADGLAVKSRVTRFHQDRIDDELAYVASKVSQINELIITDLNFGMYLNDVETAKKIADLQLKTGWPKTISASAGKNKSERIIEVAKILNGTWTTGASIQSTDPEVLVEVRRSNISSESYKELIEFGNSLENGKTHSEVILGLPGDTKDKHLESLRFGVIHQVTHLRMFQAMLLMGTEMAEESTRSRHQLQTKFRTIAGCVGVYDVYGELVPIVEVEEIIISTKSLSFSDYLECRTMNLIVETFYNGAIFFELVNLLDVLGVPYFDVLIFLLEKPHLRSKKVAAIFNEFVVHTSIDLYDTASEAENIALIPEIMNRYIGGELGINELLVCRSDLLMNFDDICELLFAAAKELLSNRGLLSDNLDDYLSELRKYILLRKKDIISEDFKVYEDDFSFDFLTISDQNFKVHPDHIRRQDNAFRFRFGFSDTQKTHIANQFRVYENTPNGLSRLVQRSNLKLFYRTVSRVTSHR